MRLKSLLTCVLDDSFELLDMFLRQSEDAFEHWEVGSRERVDEPAIS
jgi:hypothetical protein